MLVALGLKKALLHVDEPLETVPAFALCGGAALYLLGHVAFRLRNLGSLNRQRLFTALVLLALIPFATSVDALVAVLAVALVHVALIGYEALHFRDARDRVRHEGDGSRRRRRQPARLPADADPRLLRPAPRPRPGRAAWSSSAPTPTS